MFCDMCVQVDEMEENLAEELDRDFGVVDTFVVERVCLCRAIV